MSLCTAIPCWDPLLGGGGVMPHASYALLGLLSFALYFPSAALLQEQDYLRDPALDVCVASWFRAESQVAKAALLFAREFFRRDPWLSLLIGICVITLILGRHLVSTPVSSRPASHLQRLGLSLALWAHCAALASILSSLSHSAATLLLASGWAALGAAYLTLPPVLAQLSKRSTVHPSPASGVLEGLRVGGASAGGPAKRWWDIRWVTGPSDELLAPRVRINASAAQREAEERKRFFSQSGGRLLHMMATLAARLLGFEPPPPLQSMVARGRSDDYDVRDGRPPEPQWGRTKYLNLSYQDLGTAYQRPEVLRVMAGVHKTLVTLKLASNQLRDFPQAGSFPHLLTLDISINRLTSTSSLPPAPVLASVNLNSNLIPATALALRALSRYRKLKVLHIQNNPASDGDGQLYLDYVAWAAPRLVKLDGYPFVNVLSGVTGWKGVLLRTVPPPFWSGLIPPPAEDESFGQQRKHGLEWARRISARAVHVQERHPYAVVHECDQDERESLLRRAHLGGRRVATATAFRQRRAAGSAVDGGGAA